jgi:GTP cyclohydrolase I
MDDKSLPRRNSLELNAKLREHKGDNGDSRKEKIADAAKTILEALGEDPNREGLQKTPSRMAEALLYFTKGYETTLDGIL